MENFQYSPDVQEREERLYSEALIKAKNDLYNTGDNMTQSMIIQGEPAELFAALSAFQGDIESVAKSKSNLFFKSKYADLAACWDMIRKPLAKHGLTVTQLPIGREGNLITILGHKSGAYLQFGHALTPVKDDPQGHGSSITYNRRYCLTAVLGLAQDDDDGNAASAKVASGLTDKQVEKIKDLLEKYNMSSIPILTHFEVTDMRDIPPAKYSTVCRQINTKGKAKLAKKDDIPDPENSEHAK